jgi:hypothetical protein
VCPILIVRFFLETSFLKHFYFVLSAKAPKVFSRKSGEEQANLSENGRAGQEAPVQPCSASSSLGSASRGRCGSYTRCSLVIPV